MDIGKGAAGGLECGNSTVIAANQRSIAMPATTRVERDSMGPLEGPSDALWGAQTQRALQNFPVSGLRMPRAFILALGLIKYAAAGANQELGDLSAETARAVSEIGR